MYFSQSSQQAICAISRTVSSELGLQRIKELQKSRGHDKLGMSISQWKLSFCCCHIVGNVNYQVMSATQLLFCFIFLQIENCHFVTGWARQTLLLVNFYVRVSKVNSECYVWMYTVTFESLLVCILLMLLISQYWRALNLSISACSLWTSQYTHVLYEPLKLCIFYLASAINSSKC